MSPRLAKEPADVVVIGGGIIGLSVAYELLRGGEPARFRRTVVLERGLAGSGATQAAGGMIAPISEAEVQSRAVVELGLDSLQRWGDFAAGIEQLTPLRCGYQREGTLWVAADGDELRELEHVQALQRDKGVASTLLTAREVLEREPHLSSRLSGGLRIALDHRADPRRVTAALVAALDQLGGSLREGFTVEQLEREGERWAVRGRDPTGQPFCLQARSVVLAAGAFSEQGLSSPLPSLGLRPVKGQALRLEQGRGRLLRHALRNPRVYLVPRDDGALFVGATSEEQGFEGSSTAGATLDLLRYAWRLLPGIYDLPLTELIVGFRPALRDHQPAIGPLAAPECRGLYLAIGHYRDGILLAPATAHYLAQAIREEQVPAALAPFLPERLLAPPAASAAALAPSLAEVAR
ncbi:MAG: glycine oxidase ThiO [Proteobacteria bacterium]|nr:glycine oxidase ThiO [Pseudomonadota bacterium]